MFNKVIKVEPLKDFYILVTFEKGKRKYYDVKPLFKKWKVFEELENNNELFLSVKVDKGGFGISWNDHIDLSCNELWENGKENIE